MSALPAKHITPNEYNHANAEDASSVAGASNDEGADNDEEKPRRRRRRRGGRRRGPKDEQILDGTDDSAPSPNSISSGSPPSDSRSSEPVAKVKNETDYPIAVSTAGNRNSGSEEEPEPKRRRRVRRKASSEPAANDATSEILVTDGQPNVSDTAYKSAEQAVLSESGRADGETTGTKPEAREMAQLPAAASDSPANTVTIVDAETAGDNNESRRKGWWQKLVE